MTLDEALEKIRWDRDPPEPWLQAIIDETAAEIRAAFKGEPPVLIISTPSPALRSGGDAE